MLKRTITKRVEKRGARDDALGRHLLHQIKFKFIFCAASRTLSYQSLMVWQKPVKKGPDRTMHVAALAKSSAPSAKVPEMKGQR